MNFRKYMQGISDEDLLKAFEELQDLRDTGVLCDGIVRKIQREYRNLIICHSGFPTIDNIKNEIFYEMAMRYYELKCE